MSRYEVDMTNFKDEAWNNRWYVCPNCGYDSIDVGFNCCPVCEEGLYFPADDAQEKEE